MRRSISPLTTTQRPGKDGQGRDGILVADDDRRFRERLARTLHRRGYWVLTAPVSPAAAWLAKAAEVEHAIVDVRTSRRTSLDLVASLWRVLPGVRIIALTGPARPKSASLETIRSETYRGLSGPDSVREVLAALTEGETRDRNLPMPVRASSLARAEWEHIIRVLAECGGNVSETARRLRISRRTLQLKLKKGAPGD